MSASVVGDQGYDTVNPITRRDQNAKMPSLRVWLDNWTYTADLAPILKSGLDSSDQILWPVVDRPIAWVNNEFRSVTSGNFTVAFESAYYYGLNVSSKPDAERFDDVFGNVLNFEIPAHRVFIRKTDSNFGWDWVQLILYIGPAFAPCGIMKPEYSVTLSNGTASAVSSFLTSSQLIFVEETSVDIYKLGQNFSVLPVQTADWVVNVTLALRSAGTYDSPKLVLAFEAQDSPILNLIGQVGKITGVISSEWVYLGLWQIGFLRHPSQYKPNRRPELPCSGGFQTQYRNCVNSTEVVQLPMLRIEFRTVVLAQLNTFYTT
ncbi:hypothetical protein C8J57DRAFT_1230004 [Mycena rebaudengoi]|nr:hypothetical protein C8J57DRAFT_1230004 [Mycena rebaudengoi]